MDVFEQIVSDNYTQDEMDETVNSAMRNFRSEFAHEFASVEPRVTLRDRVRITLTGHL
jgi:Rps23 Pro-64 3,4-dihydroxylase Tpa1-like proline 4-hydroxylase